MRTLYIECNMGAAGDMLAAALLELVPDREAVLAQLNNLGIPGLQVKAETMVKQGITGTHLRVTVHGEEEESHDHDHEHHHEHEHHHDHEHEHEHVHHMHHHVHRGPGEIARILESLPLPAGTVKQAKEVYGLLADAEAAVHGAPVEEVHFHEVGALDAIADIVSVCLLMDILKPERVVVSPVVTGFGQVRCAHGLMPVPAPATARLLEGIPMTAGSQEGELCTPTGAALLRHFADGFGRMPVMQVEKIGYGMGKKDFPAANCVRVFLGETEEQGDTILELQCNLDDLTPEALGFAQEQLMEAGALDVYTTAIGMKKNRPGTLLTCLCRPEKREEMLRLIFRHTTTLGVREHLWGRAILQREERTEDTAAGPVRVKTARGWGVIREKAEYEDLAAIARNKGISLKEAADLLKTK
jgi:uncharacterized protein (TIGR00299 family) protein